PLQTLEKTAADFGGVLLFHVPRLIRVYLYHGPDVLPDFLYFLDWTDGNPSHDFFQIAPVYQRLLQPAPDESPQQPEDKSVSDIVVLVDPKLPAHQWREYQ